MKTSARIHGSGVRGAKPARRHGNIHTRRTPSASLGDKRHAKVKETSRAPASEDMDAPSFGEGRRLALLTVFARQLYVLVSCGTPLVQSLGALQRQTSDEQWQYVLQQVQKRVEEGSSLADAMADYPQCFDSICRTLVAAGESSGNLQEMLDRLAGLTQQRLAVRRSVVGTLIYPILLMTVAGGALMLLLIVVIPRFSEMFATLGTELPPLTKMLVVISDVIRTRWWLVLGAIAGAGTAIFFAMRTPSGRSAIDTALLRAPRIGPIVRHFATARLARIIGVLLESHVPLLESLSLARGAVSNARYAELLTAAQEAVRRGDPLSSAFSDPRLVDPAVHEAMRSGEEAGQLGSLLLNVAGFLDEENDATVKALTSVLEPVILIALGLMIGFVAVGMFMPLFDLAAMTKGGG